MTIKEVGLLAGIPKANIRFYEKEGLLKPGRNANNYREYDEEDVERLKRIRILRMVGISVADISRFMDGKCELAELLEQRVKDIEREETALAQVKELCREVKAREWNFDTLDSGYLDLRLSELKLLGGAFMKKDRINYLCKARDMAFFFCFLCILSMLMFPVNHALGIQVPETALEIWVGVITISPFPALILWAAAAGRARWDVPDMNRILMDSGSTLKKVEKDRGKRQGKRI